MSDRPILTAIGVAAVALGVLMVVQPGLATAVGVDYLAVLLIGALAVVQSLRVARSRRASEIRGAETPDVETVETMPTPGREFDDRVAGLRSGPRRTTVRERDDLRESLTEAAVAAVERRENCSREAARERVDDGTWTDDRFAAAFLGGSDAPDLPLRTKLRFGALGRSLLQRQLSRTADAVARAADVEEGEA